MLLLLLSCDPQPPQTTPLDWASPADCAVLPASGKRDACYVAVLPAVFCADPDRGQTLLAEIAAADFRDAVLTAVTRDAFPTTDAYCAQVLDAERQALCRKVVRSARLEDRQNAAGCASPPHAALPRADWCRCDGPDSTLRIFSPQITPAVADVAALLGQLPARLLRCQQQVLYPDCPCFAGEAAVVMTAADGAVIEAAVTGDLPAAAASCFEEAAEGHTLSGFSGSVRLPVGIAQ